MRLIAHFCALIGAALICGAIAAAAQRPREIEIPCKVVNIVDGDTLDVAVPVKCRVKLVGGGWLDVNTIIVRVRLLDCWAPESRSTDLAEKARGLAAKEYLTQRAMGEEGFVRVPIESNRLIDHMTLERILGELFIRGRNVGAAVVRAGHASTVKGGKLGE